MIVSLSVQLWNVELCILFNVHRRPQLSLHVTTVQNSHKLNFPFMMSAESQNGGEIKSPINFKMKFIRYHLPPSSGEERWGVVKNNMKYIVECFEHSGGGGDVVVCATNNKCWFWWKIPATVSTSLLSRLLWLLVHFHMEILIIIIIIVYRLKNKQNIYCECNYKATAILNWAERPANTASKLNRSYCL